MKALIQAFIDYSILKIFFYCVLAFHVGGFKKAIEVIDNSEYYHIYALLNIFFVYFIFFLYSNMDKK